jgi:hypothetical protein
MSTQAVTFIVLFLAILGLFIYSIGALSRWLSYRISQASFDLVERGLIGGIVLGVLSMFQPWFFMGYRFGFLLVLFATLGFIVWSHITPASPQYDEPG